MDFETKTEFVDVLSACQAMRDKDTRNKIVDELKKIRGHIPRSEVERLDIVNIVDSSLNYPNGFKELLKVIRFYEGPTTHMEAVNLLGEKLVPGVEPDLTDNIKAPVETDKKWPLPLWFLIALGLMSMVVWYNRPDIVGSTDGTPTPTFIRTIDLDNVRPEDNGLFRAAYNANIQLDGRIEDWPNMSNMWQSIDGIVYDRQSFDGPDDLSADFETAWSFEGLYLALSVVDDLHRSGPENENMYMGDGIEIHFDRQLRTDFDGDNADSDDYQIGVNFGPHRDHLNSFRWLPANLKGQVSVAGAINPNTRGYVAEIFFPWEIFELSADQIRPENVYGFNVSINDNDSDQDAQQTVLSTSHQRKAFNNPTQWGTLLLVEN